MTVRPIVITGEPVLHTTTRPVDDDEFGSAELASLVEDLFDTMDAAHGVGLAANQIGVARRVFVYDCPDPELDGERRRGVVVNPVLETGPVPETMPDEDDDAEGCLSVPGESFPTGRADRAKVTGRDVEGAPVEVEGIGFFARCLQHEADHLAGTIYVDRLMGRHDRAARKSLKRHGWGVPGISWDPATEHAEDQ